MNFDEFLSVLGLLLIAEGLMPLVAPARWKETLLSLARLADGQIRFIGLAAVCVGLLLLALVP